MKQIVVLIAALFPLFAMGATFDLVTEGDQVCKSVENNKTCFSRLSVALQGFQVSDKLEIIDNMTKYLELLEKKGVQNLDASDLDAVGGALLFEKEDIKTILSQYRRLSVRNIGIDPNVVETEDAKRVGFVASVYWKSTKLGLNSTVNVEGYINVPKNDAQTDLGKRDLAEFRKLLTRAVEIAGISDSSGENHREGDRRLEKLARELHFTLIAGKNKERVDVDKETEALLKNIIAPYVMGEVVVIPTVKAFGEMIRQAFVGIFKGMFGDTTQGLEQPVLK